MDNTRELVIAHYKEMIETQPQYAPTRMAELAPGVIAVEDASGECDALFDTGRWQFSEPELWGGQDPKSFMLRRRNLNVLEGLGRMPYPVSTITAMMGFAKSHLFSKNGESWYGAPTMFMFEF